MAASYQDLIAWQKAMSLVVDVYRATKSFPKEELFGLTSQMRRAAVSVPSNIAEGHGRLTNRDRMHFVATARGSLLELETQVRIAVSLSYLDPKVARMLLDSSTELGRIVNGLLKSFREK